MYENDLIECPIGHDRLFHQHHNGRSRLITQIGEGHIKRFPWIEQGIPLENGIYCDKCVDAPRIELNAEDLASFGLDDLPLEVPNHETAAERIVQIVQNLVCDYPHAVITTPARDAVYGQEPTDIPPRVRRLLPDRLYSHQTEAIEAAFAGHDVVQTTGTGSGKSVGMWAPVIATLAANPTATAVAILPRIALANDQVDRLASFSEECVVDKSLFTLSLGEGFAPIEVGVMNCHTTQSHQQILKKARLIVTTPDQLHKSILPYLKQSPRFVANLRFVVLDEIHTYTGDIGSKTTALMRRLQINCLSLQNNCRKLSDTAPQFLMSSAHLENGEEFMHRLTGRRSTIIVSRDGSPKKPFTTFVIEANHRDFIPKFHTAIAQGFNGAPPTGLSFVQSKEGVKDMAKVSQSALENAGFKQLAAHAVATYSAQDDGESRVDKERRINQDEARFVLTTSALELGVDFRNVHYSISTEFNGMVMETRQRLGRAGRLHAGVGIVLLEPCKRPSWPMTPQVALDTILFAPATIQTPEMTSHDRNQILFGLAHDCAEIDLNCVRHADPQLATEMVTSEYWEVSGDTNARSKCTERLSQFRGGTHEKGTVSSGNKILKTWNGSELVKFGWCGYRLTTPDGWQYEVVSVKRNSRVDGSWEIKVERKDDFLEVEATVVSNIIDEVVSTSDSVGNLTFTRSEGRLRHFLNSSRRRTPGEDWEAPRSNRRVNQSISEQTAVTLIQFSNATDRYSMESVRCLIMACLDAIGVSQFDIWSEVQGDRILFYDPQGRTSPIAWSIIDRIDDLVGVAWNRVAQFGYLNSNGCRIERDELELALGLLSPSSAQKAA